MKPPSEQSPKMFAADLNRALVPSDHAQTGDDLVKIALCLTYFKILPKTVFLNFGLMFLADWLAKSIANYIIMPRLYQCPGPAYPVRYPLIRGKPCCFGRQQACYCMGFNVSSICKNYLLIALL